MHFSTDQQDATTVFRLKETRLDSRNAGQLKAEFLILSQPDIDTLIIDLTEVRQIDSAGLSALLLAHRQMASHDGEVRLVGASEDVQSLLRVTQLDRIFPLFNSVDEALDAEPSFGDEEDEETPESGALNVPLAPGAPSANEIRAGAIVAGGSFGAAALTRIMMTPYEEELDQVNVLAFGDEEDYDDEEEDLDEDLDDEFEEDEDFAEEVKDEEAAEEVEEDDLLEDDDFEDDDFDDEELEEDEDEDY